MGLKSLAYNLGWFIFNYAKAFAVNLNYLLIINLIYLLLKIGLIYLTPCLIAGAFDSSNLTVGEIILAYALFICAALNQCYMYTTFFSSPKLPSELITLVHLVASAL